MNINRKLKKISRNLQELALEMEIAARPRGKKGDYIYVHRDRDYFGNIANDFFVARLVTDPYLSDDYEDRHPVANYGEWLPYPGYWIVDFVFESGRDFRESTAIWRKKRWHFSERKAKKVSVKNWNPPLDIPLP